MIALAVVLNTLGEGAAGAEPAAQVSYVRGLVPPHGSHSSCIFTPDGDRLLASGARLRYFQARPPYAFLQEHSVSRHAECYSRDRRNLYALGTDALLVKNVADFSTAATLPYLQANGDKLPSGYVVASADGKKLALANSRKVVVVNAYTFKPLSSYTLDVLATRTAFLAFVDDDKKLIGVWTKEDDYYVVAARLIDTETGTAEEFPYAKETLYIGSGFGAVSPDQSTLIVDARTKTDELEAIDVRTLKPKWRVEMPVRGRHYAYSPDGRWILVNGHPQFTSEADAKQYEACAFRIYDSANGKLAWTMPVDTPGLIPPHPMRTFAFSPDGKILATCSYYNGDPKAPIVLWDWAKIEAELLEKSRP